MDFGDGAVGRVSQKAENLRAHGVPLNGWRSIATYLGRNQSTVKRWAAAKQLPVHRPQGSEARKGVPVYAFADELDAWIKGHSNELLATISDDVDPAPTGIAGTAPIPNIRRPTRRALAIGLLATGLFAAGVLGWRPLRGSGVLQAKPVPDQARALLLEASYLWQKRTPETLQQAHDLLMRTIEIAPRFAAAHADLAIVHNLMVEYEVSHPQDGYAQSRAAAGRAVSLDPGNARAYSVLGDVAFFWDRDYDSGLALLQKAVSLGPKDATARHWFAAALMARGRYGEAATEIRAARELEPLSRSIMVSQAMIALGQGQPESARQLLGQIALNEPTYRSPYRFLAFAELAINNYRGYLAALTQRFELTQDPAGLRVVAAGESGWRSGGADKMVQAMVSAVRDNPQEQKDVYFVAHWLALGGDWTGAAKQLAQTPSRRFVYYGIDPAFAEATMDADFRRKVMEAGLPIVW